MKKLGIHHDYAGLGQGHSAFTWSKGIKLRSGVWGPGCGLRLRVRELGFSFLGKLGASGLRMAWCMKSSLFRGCDIASW